MTLTVDGDLYEIRLAVPYGGLAAAPGVYLFPTEIVCEEVPNEDDLA